MRIDEGSRGIEIPYFNEQASFAEQFFFISVI